MAFFLCFILPFLGSILMLECTYHIFIRSIVGDSVAIFILCLISPFLPFLFCMVSGYHSSFWSVFWALSGEKNASIDWFDDGGFCATCQFIQIKTQPLWHFFSALFHLFCPVARTKKNLHRWSAMEVFSVPARVRSSGAYPKLPQRA